MTNWILLVFVFFTMVIDQGLSDADDSDPPPVLELNSTFMDDDVHINNDDFISDFISQNNETIVDNGDDKNFGNNDTEKISDTNELVELKDTEINVKMDEVQLTLHAKVNETEANATEISESEMDNVDVFPSHDTDSKHIEIIFVEDGNVFPDVAANEMLKLLDDDLDIFEEMKKKVNLLELQMRKNEDLHLYHQGILGQIEAAEIVLSTLTPFEEDLEAVKEYVVKLDHQLDNSTADFVTKFVVRADNFLKKAQQSLEIIQYENENDNGEQIREDNSLTIENKTRESGEYESTYSSGNSQTESILSYNINTENSMYEPIIESSMGESELKENDVELSTSVNEEGNSVAPSGTDSLAQDYISQLQNDHDATEGINGVKDMNDDVVDSTEIKSSINNPNEAIEEDLVRRLNPKFKHLFEKAPTHRHAQENIKNGGKEETEDGGWMTGMSLFSLLTSGLLVVILVCWMVGKIVLRSNSYKRLDASHRNC